MKTITVRNGTSVESPFTDDVVFLLAQPLTDTFVQDILKKAKGDVRNLSEEQVKWLHVKVVKAQKGYVAPAANTVEVGDLTDLKALLVKAGEKLKYPKIRLQVGSTNVVLGLTNKGEVRITDSDNYRYNERFGRDMPIYYGAINAEGQYNPTSSMSAGLTMGLTDMLKAMATDPVKTAQEYGRLTGRCCFCGKSLDDERSTAVGYGPTCAKNFELPWGSGVAETVIPKAPKKAKAEKSPSKYGKDELWQAYRAYNEYFDGEESAEAGARARFETCWKGGRVAGYEKIYEEMKSYA